MSSVTLLNGHTILRTQESITQSEQMSHGSRHHVFAHKLFLERFWREIRISFKSHKPVRKTYRPENVFFFTF